jgi:hypothetical protein
MIEHHLVGDVECVDQLKEIFLYIGGKGVPQISQRTVMQHVIAFDGSIEQRNDEVWPVWTWIRCRQNNEMDR